LKTEPQREHEWLQTIVGEWTYETECDMGPDKPAWKSSGTETVRSLGGLWIVTENQGETPDGEPVTSIITLGYDPAKQKFVGTFVGSVMSNLWVYEGVLAPDGKTLPLETEGPSFTEKGTTAKYQDVVEISNKDLWILRSRFLGDDGAWHEFMTMTHRRAK
jgi:Protein of unknown function (DUF1579)